MFRPSPRAAAAALAAIAALAFTGAHAQSALSVELDAQASFTRSYAWSIDKSVTPQFSDRFIGETQQLDYTIAVNRGIASDSDFLIEGAATIVNPTGQTATISSITVMLGASLVTHSCGTGELAAGGELECSFSVHPTSADSQALSVEVATSGSVAGASDAMQVEFGDPTLANGSVTVIDSNLPGEEFVFDDSGIHGYSLGTACINGNSVVVDNTASIVGTDASDTVQARVGCHILRMDRNAVTGGGSHWTWDIEKSHAETLPLNLFAGQSYDVDYTITATATAGEGGEGTVNGNIVVYNTHPTSDADLVSVQALINGSLAAAVDCPSLVVPDAQYDAASNVIFGQLVCPFTVTLPPGETASTVTGIVTQQLYAYAADGTATAAGTRVYSGTAGVSGGGSSEQTDECIDLTDLYQGIEHELGTFCASDSPVVLIFTGTILVTAESECSFEVPNLASFVTNDTATTGEDDTVVSVVRSDCEAGCTRTQGYWKTHSIYGPAPYDDTWATIGEDTTFYMATDRNGDPLSWYEVLWTPTKGNAYFILASQYIAATLNMLAGADASAQVLDAMEDATSLFETWTSAEIGALRGNRPPRPEFIELAGVLDMYNNGVGGIGPEHCSEDANSVE